MKKKNVAESFATAMSDRKMIFEFLDGMPYLVQVFALDGTSVYTNQTGNEAMNVADPSEVIGKYNVLNDPIVNDVLGLREGLKKAFKGEKVTVSEVRVPYEDLSVRYTQIDENFSKILYEQIYSFPLLDEKGNIEFIAMIFQTGNTYNEKQEIAKAKEYMNSNWLEKYDLDKIAAIGERSPKHFIGFFKKYTGQTPYEYYKLVKIKRIKEELINPEISIITAFNKCGVNYNDTYIKLFKEVTGMTPIEYRKEKSVK